MQFSIQNLNCMVIYLPTCKKAMGSMPSHNMLYCGELVYSLWACLGFFWVLWFPPLSKSIQRLSVKRGNVFIIVFWVFFTNNRPSVVCTDFQIASRGSEGFFWVSCPRWSPSMWPTVPTIHLQSMYSCSTGKEIQLELKTQALSGRVEENCCDSSKVY